MQCRQVGHVLNNNYCMLGQQCCFEKGTFGSWLFQKVHWTCKHYLWNQLILLKYFVELFLLDHRIRCSVASYFLGVRLNFIRIHIIVVSSTVVTIVVVHSLLLLLKRVLRLETRTVLQIAVAIFKISETCSPKTMFSVKLFWRATMYFSLGVLEK